MQRAHSREIEHLGGEEYVRASSMSIRDYVLNPLVIRTLNRTIRRALGCGPRGEPRSARILIVEGDALIREMLATTLRDAGYETDVAADGREALERFEANPADLVITDMRKPDAFGATRTLARPFDNRQLLAAVRDIVPR